ncbi:MAG: hypothetical protein ACFCD0_16785 [Gemmataceae bacterium]
MSNLSLIIRRVSMTTLAAILTTVVLAGSASNANAQTKKDVGLEGYCPVCILKAKKWVPGNSQYQSTYDNKTYYFPGAKEKQIFDNDPTSYVPALGGDCTVCYEKIGKRVPGKVKYGAFYNNRVFLFPGAKEQGVFLKTPGAFADVDLALKGDCAVCLVEVKKRVPGKAEFTVIHEGFRYLFPSAKQMKMFQANPQKYVNALQTNTNNQPPQAAKASNNKKIITVTGRAGCAACEHGVTPLGAKETLGLAVNTKDGKVYVVENAHKLYPKLYKARYDNPQLQLVGRVIRTQGKISWVASSKLSQLQ